MGVEIAFAVKKHSILSPAKYQPAAAFGTRGPAAFQADEDDAMNVNFEEIYHFLFETMPGIGVLVGIGLLASIIVCVILERKTRKQFKNHEKTEDDWSLFDDDEDGEEN